MIIKKAGACTLSASAKMVEAKRHIFVLTEKDMYAYEQCDKKICTRQSANIN